MFKTLIYRCCIISEFRLFVKVKDFIYDNNV